MQCYECDREATQRCPRCGNAYCDEHGGAFCDACLSPLAAAPSRGVYRFALLGLFGGAVLALWLLIQPPSVPGEEPDIIRGGDPTATPALTPAQGGTGGPTLAPTPTRAPGETVAPTPTPTAGPTAEPTDPPTDAPTEAPAGPIEYVVQDGDSWNGIAAAYGLDGETLAAYNGYTLDDILQVGITILIPQ